MKTMMMVFKKHFGGMGEYERYRHEYSNVNIFFRIYLDSRTRFENQHSSVGDWGRSCKLVRLLEAPGGGSEVG